MYLHIAVYVNNQNILIMLRENRIWLQQNSLKMCSCSLETNFLGEREVDGGYTESGIHILSPMCDNVWATEALG